MGKSAKLLYDGKEIELPLLTGTENEDAIDISKIRSETGLITRVIRILEPQLVR